MKCTHHSLPLRQLMWHLHVASARVGVLGDGGGHAEATGRADLLVKMITRAWVYRCHRICAPYRLRLNFLLLLRWLLSTSNVSNIRRPFFDPVWYFTFIRNHRFKMFPNLQQRILHIDRRGNTWYRHRRGGTLIRKSCHPEASWPGRAGNSISYSLVTY